MLLAVSCLGVRQNIERIENKFKMAQPAHPLSRPRFGWRWVGVLPGAILDTLASSWCVGQLVSYEIRTRIHLWLMAEATWPAQRLDAPPTRRATMAAVKPDRSALMWPRPVAPGKRLLEDVHA